MITVLHVDDDSAFLELTAEYLEREVDRITVESVASASVALERIDADETDCIVSDYEMPGLDGLDFLETVREEYPDLPFILFTGKGSEDVASNALSNGATDYLQKAGGAEQYELLCHRILNAVEQFRSIQRATKLDRIRTLAGDINQALVHAASREEAETRVCEIISEATPYTFAWIGEVDPDSKRIEPRCWAGDDAGYLDSITVTTDANPAGRGPGWTAVNEGRVAVTQNVQEDPAFEPWREEATERGYRAVAAVPLEFDEHRFGVLGVFATQPHAFDEEEQQLLRELGDDIGHALAAFDTRTHLEETQERMQLALEHTNSVLFEIDFGSGTVSRDGAYNDFFDIPSEDVPTWEDHLDQAVHPADRERFNDFYQGLATGKRDAGKLEYRTAPDTGEVRWIRDNVFVKIDDSNARRAIGLAQDITARKEETQVREKIIERVTDAIVEVDAEWQFTLVNERAESPYGMSEGELLGRDFWSVFSDARGTRFEDEYRQVMETREATSFVEYYPGLDGWFDIQVYPNDDGGIAFYFRDVTDLREREQRFEAIFNNAHTFTGLLDPDGTLLEANETALTFGGVERADVVGTPIWETVWFQSTEEARIAAREAVEQARGGDTYRDEIRVQGADADAIIDFTVRPVTNDRGEITLLVPEGRDITERREREQIIEELHATSHSLMRADSVEEIADITVETFRDTLEMPVTGLYLADEDTECLEPVAWTDGAAELVEARPTMHRGNGRAWEVFETGEAEIRDDGSTGGQRGVLETAVRRELLLPLEDQGVLVVGATDPDVFDETAMSLARTLAAHVTTALNLREREANLALKQSLLKAQQESVIDGMLVTTEDREIISYNDRFVELWGLPDDVVASGDDEAAVAWVSDQLANPDEFQETLDDLYADRTETARGEIELTDGRVFDRYSTPLIGEDGTHHGRLWTFRDITDRKQRERELKRNERIIQEMNDGVVVVKEGVITYTNRRIADITGYSQQEVQGESMVDFIAPEDRDLVQRRFRARVEGRNPPKTYEISLLSKDGEPIPVEITAARIDLGGEPGTVSIVRDISARKEREAELERETERLENFASVVSHDLRNPLNVAVGRLELAMEECESEHLDHVARAHDRMDTLITDLLTLARVGRPAEETDRVALDDLAGTCWDTVDTGNATLAIETDRAIDATRSRLQQVFENLIHNAVDHGGDAVTVTIGELDDGFFVEDDGSGIPEGDRERVFDSGFSTATGGNGFGLSIVQEIVDAHGWEIAVTESDAGGARFEITGVEFCED